MGNSRVYRRTRTTVRLFFIGFLVVFLVVVLALSIRRFNRPAVIRPETQLLTKQKVDVSENILILRDTGGKNILEVEAERRFTDAKGMYHLEGPENRTDAGVRIESRDRDGGLKYRATAEEVIYDTEGIRYVFRGNVEIQLDDIIVKGTSFTYQRDRELITTNVPANFEGKRFRGDCGRASYLLSEEKFTFFRGIRLVTAPWDTDPMPVIITGREMEYLRRSRTGTIRGDVKMAHGRSRGRCGEFFFAQFQDKPEFRRFEFQGGAAIDVDEQPVRRPVDPEAGRPKPGAAAPSSEDGLIFFEGGRQHMEAETVIFLPYGNEKWPRYVFLRSGGRVTNLDGPDRQTTLEAEDMSFYYDEGWQLQYFHLERRARIRGEAAGRMRLVEAPVVTYNARIGVLAADGTRSAEARTISGGREISAASMVINLRNNNFNMNGGVKIVSFPQAGEIRDAALFEAGKPTFMTAGSVQYVAASKKIRLGGGARLWQGRESLEGGEVTIQEGTGWMSVSGAVRSVFFRLDRSKNTDQRVEITSGRLSRTSEKTPVVFQESCSLTAGEIVMKAGRLTLEPGGPEEKYGRILADQERVAVLQGSNKAQGDQAEYDLIKDVIVLTGNTILEDNAKGIIHKEGKLTFHPADGRILIENKDAERSTTIIKS